MTPTLDMVRAFAARHAMVSFENPLQLSAAAEVCQSVVLDNGAFSAWKQGKAFDFAGYREWVAQWHRHPAVDWHVIPDVIDGSETDNDDLIRSWPFRHCAVPVWHLHESTEKLDWLCRDFERVAPGSSGDYAEVGTARWWERMGEAMAVACDSEGRPRAKLHGLRMLNPGVYSKLPLASADSCNVARNVGIDSAWTGSYAPASRTTRALVLMERIERHASAARWNPAVAGEHYQNLDLFG